MTTSQSSLVTGDLCDAHRNNPDGSFRVLPPVSAEGPSITPYLKYQTEMAWDQDEQRRKKWEGIRTEADLID